MTKRLFLAGCGWLLFPVIAFADALSGIFEAALVVIGLMVIILIGAVTAVIFVYRKMGGKTAVTLGWVFTVLLLLITMLVVWLFNLGHSRIPEFLAYPYLGCLLFLAYRQLKTRTGTAASIFTGLFSGAIAGLLSPWIKLIIDYPFFTYIMGAVVVACCFLWVKHLVGKEPAQPNSYLLKQGTVAGIFMGLLLAIPVAGFDLLETLTLAAIAVVTAALTGLIGSFMAIIVYNSNFRADP